MAAKLCNVCNIRRVYTGSKGTEIAPALSDLCNYCFEEGGHENTHSDQGHESISAKVAKGGFELTEYEAGELEMMKYCWLCHPELNLAQQGKKHQDQQSSSAAGFTRRPQLNHKGHSHPQTPAARRACKEAFWAYHRTPVYGTPEQLAKAMAKWDHQCDGHGKPVAPQGGWAGVQPKAANSKVDMQAVGEKVKATNAVAKQLGKAPSK